MNTFALCVCKCVWSAQSRALDAVVGTKEPNLAAVSQNDLEGTWLYFRGLRVRGCVRVCLRVRMCVRMRAGWSHVSVGHLAVTVAAPLSFFHPVFPWMEPKTSPPNVFLLSVHERVRMIVVERWTFTHGESQSHELFFSRRALGGCQAVWKPSQVQMPWKGFGWRRPCHLSPSLQFRSPGSRKVVKSSQHSSTAQPKPHSLYPTHPNLNPRGECRTAGCPALPNK